MQLDQRIGKVLPVGLRARIGVGLELVLARQRRRERRDEEAERRQREHQQQQRQRIVGHAADVRRDAQPRVEPLLLRQPAEQCQRGQAASEHRQHALGHMLQLEVAELVCEHGFHFIRRQALQQRVEEDHTLGRAEAGEVRIRMRRALAAVHHEQALGAKAAAGHERAHALGQRCIGQRREFVEQRRDHGRVEQQHQQLKSSPGQPCPPPPPRSGRAHDPQHQRRQRQADGRADQRALGGIEQVQLPRHAVEAKTLFDAKRVPSIERHVDHAADRRHRAEQCELVGHRTETRLHGITHPTVDRIEPAEQRPCQQHHGAEGQADEAEACAGQRVVRGLLMRFERHRANEGRRHLTAVRRDMPHLAQRQPGLEHEARHDGGSEQRSQKQRIHDAECRAATMPAL